MNKFDYMLEAFNNKAYVKKAFLLSAFSIVEEDQNNKLEDIPFAVMKDGDKAYFVKDGVKTYIDDFIPGKALFDKNEPMTLRGESTILNVEGETKTTLGRFLFNAAVLHEAFDGEVPYINDKVFAGDIKKIIADRMVDNPAVSGIEVPEGKSSVDDCLKVTKQLDYLEGLNHIFVKAASLDIFTVHPEIIKLRDELLGKLEAEGKLNDEVAVAEVINLLIEKDAEIQYNGPSRDLFINHDFIANSRKKMFLLFDMVPDFNTGIYRLLKNSLQEGWDFSQLDGYANTAISASFDRGVGTARGGTEFKIAILLTSSIKAIKGDCGTKRYESVLINKYNFNGWVGGHCVIGKSAKLITSEDKDMLVGQRVQMRVPQYCIQPDGNLCSTCCGTKLGSLEHRLSSEVALVFTVFMLTSMKAMHISKLNTFEMPLDVIIR